MYKKYAEQFSYSNLETCFDKKVIKVNLIYYGLKIHRLKI
jgi:hypothetical protein